MQSANPLRPQTAPLLLPFVATFRTPFPLRHASKHNPPGQSVRQTAKVTHLLALTYLCLLYDFFFPHAQSAISSSHGTSFSSVCFSATCPQNSPFHRHIHFLSQCRYHVCGVPLSSCILQYLGSRDHLLLRRRKGGDESIPDREISSLFLSGSGPITRQRASGYSLNS